MIDIKDIELAVDMTPAKALEFLKKKVPTIAITEEELTALFENAQREAFTLAKVTQLSLLQDVKDLLVKALESGTSFPEFKNQFGAMLSTKGWIANKEVQGMKQPWRVQTIYRTNMQSAFQAGRISNQKAVASSRPFWRYVSVVDRNTTSGCNELQGTVLRYDDPFWKNNYPPRHYNCRALVQTLSESQMERYGYSLADSEAMKDVAPAKGFGGQPDGGYMPDKKDFDKKLFNEFNKLMP